jgi:hypothetical protein
MQHIQIDVWPGAVALAIGLGLVVVLHVTTRALDRAVDMRTRRALQRVVDEPETKTR